MYLVGPTSLKLLFHGFVVLVGVLILAGAQNTSIVGANGVLNRVAEDGVLTSWFQRPHQSLRHQLPHHQPDRRHAVARPSCSAGATSMCWPRSMPSV